MCVQLHEEHRADLKGCDSGLADSLSFFLCVRVLPLMFSWWQQHGQREGDGGRRWSRDTDALLTLTGISSSSFSASRSPCFPLPLLLLLCFSSRQLLLSVLLITMTTGPDCC